MLSAAKADEGAAYDFAIELLKGKIAKLRELSRARAGVQRSCWGAEC